MLLTSIVEEPPGESNLIRLFLAADVCFVVLTGCSKRAEPKSEYSLTIQLTDFPPAKE